MKWDCKLFCSTISFKILTIEGETRVSVISTDYRYSVKKDKKYDETTGGLNGPVQDENKCVFYTRLKFKIPQKTNGFYTLLRSRKFITFFFGFGSTFIINDALTVEDQSR